MIDLTTKLDVLILLIYFLLWKRCFLSCTINLCISSIKRKVEYLLYSVWKVLQNGLKPWLKLSV